MPAIANESSVTAAALALSYFFPPKSEGSMDFGCTHEASKAGSIITAMVFFFIFAFLSEYLADFIV
jgi:hypothetical protein